MVINMDYLPIVISFLMFCVAFYTLWRNVRKDDDGAKKSAIETTLKLNLIYDSNTQILSKLDKYDERFSKIETAQAVQEKDIKNLYDIMKGIEHND